MPLLLNCRDLFIQTLYLCIMLSPALVQAEEADFTPMFDGKTLDGWTTTLGKPVVKGWKAQDGMMIRTSSGGSIYYHREFADFDLRFEWRIGKRGNTGIKYRVARYEHGVYRNPEWLGYEYQIWDDEHRGTPAHMSTASIYLLQAPSADKNLHAIGKWNTSRIVAVGPRIEHWLNGEKVLDVDTSSDIWWHRVANTKFGEVDNIFQNSSGRIQLQDHGNKVWFRNLRIRDLHEEPEHDSKGTVN